MKACESFHLVVGLPCINNKIISKGEIMKFKKSKLSVVIASIVSFTSIVQAAESEAQAGLNQEKQQLSKAKTAKLKEADVEKIIVTGFKESIDAAEQNKKHAQHFIDGISSAGLGEFADESIGEAIYSLPGVDIDFVNGIADGVTIGGLPSEFNQIQINGSPVGSTNDSASGNLSGAQSLGPFSTALISGVTVHKSARADLQEGALGGVVNLKSWKPLNFKKTRFNIGVKAGYQELSEESDGKFNLLYGSTNDDQTLGWVFGVTHEINKNRTDAFTGHTGKKNLDRSDADRETAASGVYTHRQTQNEFTRDNFLGALSAQITDSLVVTLDGSYAKYDREKLEQASNYSINSAAKYNQDSSLYETIPYSDSTGSVTQLITAGVAIADLNDKAGSNHQMRSFHRVQEDESKTLSLTADWIINDNFDMTAKIAHIENNFSWHPEEKGHQYFTDYRSFVYDVVGENELPSFFFLNDDAIKKQGGKHVFNYDAYPDFDIANRDTWGAAIDNSELSPADYQLTSHLADKKYNEVKADSAKVDFTYYLDSNLISAVKFGLAYNKVENLFDTVSYSNNQALKNAWLKQRFSMEDVGYGDTLGNFLGGHNNAGTPSSWWVADWDNTKEAIWGAGAGTWEGAGFEALPELDRIDSKHTGELSTLSAYLMADFQTDDLIGNFGLRAVKDDYNALSYSPIVGSNLPGMIDNPTTSDTIPETENALNEEALAAWNNPDNFAQRTGGREDTYLLPSFNLRYTLIEESNLFLRLAASRNMARAPFTQTKANYNVNVNTDDGENSASVNGQNPGLEPTFSNNYSLGLEWYASKDLRLTAGIHHKNLSNVRSTLTRIEEDVSIIDPTTGEEVINGTVTYRMPEGNGSGTVDSVEIGYRQNFTFLPSFLANTGLIANYTYVDSEVYAPVDGGRIKLNSSAPNSVNTQLFYQDKKFTARFAYTWRDERLGSRETESGFSQWDSYRRNLNFSSSYKWSKNLKVTFNVNNVTDEFQTKYRDNSPYMLSSYKTSGRHFLLGVSYTM